MSFEIGEGQSLFALQKSYGSGDETITKVMVSTSDLILGQQLYDNDEEFEQFLDAIDNWGYAASLIEAFNQNRNLVEELSEKGYIAISYEEGFMGIGITKELAYVGYVLADLEVCGTFLKGRWEGE